MALTAVWLVLPFAASLSRIVLAALVMGGAIWGLSSALHEKTELDLRTARYINDNFADYHIPVNADTPEVMGE